MNQKLIDQLLHKAGARFGAEGTDYSDFTSSKFAELIVKECTSVLLDEAERLLDLCSEEDNRKLADAYESGHYQCIDNIDMIKTHFGVEE